MTGSTRYAHSKLIEINSHSLFSKWFSESGKLVGKLFANITELVDDDATFVVVLIGTLSSWPGTLLFFPLGWRSAYVLK
jgi:pachytene checkpoint protein 2